MTMRWTSLGPFADAANAHLAVPALQGEVLGHAIAAVDLDRAVDDPAPALAGQQLGHRRLGAERLAAGGLAGGGEDRPTRRADVDFVVHDHPLNRLARGERGPERLALLGVLDRHLLGADGDAEAAGGIGDALARQPVIGDREAAVHLAEHVRVRHPRVLELQLGAVVAGAQGVHDAAHVEAGRVSVDDEACDAAAALVGVGAREDDAEVGPVGAGDEDLRAVDHPVVALAHRLGADGARGVGTAGWLGEAEESALLAAQHGEEVALLLVVVGLVELRQPRAPKGAEAGGVEARPVLRRLDGDQGLGDDVDVRPAKLGRDAEAIEAHRPGDAGQARVVFRLDAAGVGVELGLQRPDLLTHEPPHLVDDLRLLGGRLKIHPRLPYPGLSRPRRWSAGAVLPGGSAPWSALCTIKSSS